MTLLTKSLSFPAPSVRVAAYEREFYSRSTGVEKIRFRMIEDGDDLFTKAEYSFSTNNGGTWGDEIPFAMRETLEGRYTQEYPIHLFLDVREDVLIQFYLMCDFQVLNEAEHLVNHSDAFKSSYIGYRCSHDGGRTWLPSRRLKQEDGEHSNERPFDSIRLGRNGMAENAQNGILQLSDGTLLAAFGMSDFDEKDEVYNPVGAYTWYATLVLKGKLQSRSQLQLTEVGTFRIDATQSTRGLIEPTLVEFPNGTILMVLRGSNGGSSDPEYAIPSFKWYTISKDSGETWSELRPWSYANGNVLYSPSSISVLIRHSSGEVYWFGNISESNARANLPRTKLVYLKVDPLSYLPMSDEISVVDEAEPGDGVYLSLSNFSVQEDRLTGHFILNMTRWGWKDNAPTGDAFRYVLSVKKD